MAALLASSYPLSTYSDPAYGLLRTFSDESGGWIFRAYDIEVDEEGIYIVGAASSARDDKAVGGWTPFLLALERDHTLKCKQMFGFLPRGQEYPDGVAVAVETNETHAIVAGYFMLTTEGITNLFVAAFSKVDCSLTSTYAAIVALQRDARTLVDLYGEGIDLAMDETGIYVLTGLTIFKFGGGEKTTGFLLIRLDPYLVLRDYMYYFVTDPSSDFATSLALGAESIYILGLTGLNLEGRGVNADGLFILEVSKNDLLGRNVTLVQPIDAFAVNSEILVDEGGYVYVVATEEKPGARDNVAAIKLDREMNVVWWQHYALSFSYPEAPDSPPVNKVSMFDYAFSAALSDSELFIGGYLFFEYQSDRGVYYIPHGILLAVDRSTGGALYSYRIQGFDDVSLPVMVFGVDSYEGCAYLAGMSQGYRLEYVFLNSLNLSLQLPTSGTTTSHHDIKPDSKEYEPKYFDWSPVFDTDQASLGTKGYGFYGVFCGSSLIERTTTTSTSYTTVAEYTTITETRISRTTSTRIIRVTETRLTTEYITNLLESTVYTTSLVLSTAVDRVVVSLIRTETATTYVTDTSPRLIRTTTTMLQNVTQMITKTETQTVDGGFVVLPPWLFPLFLLPIPVLALLGRRRRYRIVIKEGVVSPPGWKEGDPPIFSDAYLYPSVLSLAKGSVVEFVNNDSVEHVLVSYDGPSSGRFVSEPIKPGSKWAYKFREPGIYFVTSRRKPFIGGLIRVGE